MSDSAAAVKAAADAAANTKPPPPHDLESGKTIVALYEKKIEVQNNVAVGFFGASIVVFLTFFTRQGKPLDVDYDWTLWLSYLLFGLTILFGYFARMSLIACVPSMLNYPWGEGDAARARYGGKPVLEGFLRGQVACFLFGLAFTGLFFALNMRSFVS